MLNIYFQHVTIFNVKIYQIIIYRLIDSLIKNDDNKSNTAAIDIPVQSITDNAIIPSIKCCGFGHSYSRQFLPIRIRRYGRNI